MKFFLTGGLGVVGSEIARALVREGHSVTILDAAESPRNEWTATQLTSQLKDRVSIIRQRMEKGGLEIALSHDAVIHAAASTGIPHSSLNPADDWISNVEATRELLETYRLNRSYVPPTVIFSSVKPYDPSLTLIPRETRYEAVENGVNENCVLSPDEPYAASKMAQSALSVAYARTYDLPVATIRFSNLYGPAPCHGPRHGWLTWFAISAAIGMPIQVQGDGRQTRDMLYTSDIHRAVQACLQNIDKCAGKVFNVGGGKDNTISVKEAAYYLHANYGATLFDGPGRKHEDLLFITDYSRFQAATGWSPLVKPHEGISMIYDWAKAHSDDLREIYE